MAHCCATSSIGKQKMKRRTTETSEQKSSTLSAHDWTWVDEKKIDLFFSVFCFFSSSCIIFFKKNCLFYLLYGQNLTFEDVTLEVMTIFSLQKKQFMKTLEAMSEGWIASCRLSHFIKAPYFSATTNVRQLIWHFLEMSQDRINPQKKRDAVIESYLH